MPTTNLGERLIARIRARGPITFAEYMEAALFDPQDGYYTSRVALGFDGDYLTASDLGPHFARALARAFADLWMQLGRPAAWDLVEAGAGRGVFLRDVLVALERERADAAKGARPTIVEVSPRLREQQSTTLAGRDLRWASDARALAPVQGVIFANEVLDAFPVHVLVRTADGVRAEGWVASLGPALTSGYVVFVDYGGDENELLTRLGAGTLRGFSRHRLIMDPYAEPGARDLTASVNFTAIRRAAEGAGFVFAGRSTQRDALITLGIREPTARAATPIEQLRALGRRSAIDTLLDPNGFGAFEFVCFAKDAPTDGLRMFGTRASSEVRYP